MEIASDTFFDSALNLKPGYFSMENICTLRLCKQSLGQMFTLRLTQ